MKVTFADKILGTLCFHTDINELKAAINALYDRDFRIAVTPTGTPVVFNPILPVGTDYEVIPYGRSSWGGSVEVNVPVVSKSNVGFTLVSSENCVCTYTLKFF